MKIDKQLTLSLSEWEQTTLVDAKDLLLDLCGLFEEHDELGLSDECNYILTHLEQLFAHLNRYGANLSADAFG